MTDELSASGIPRSFSSASTADRAAVGCTARIGDAIRDNLHVALSLHFLESIDRRASAANRFFRRMHVKEPRVVVALLQAVIGTSKPNAQPRKVGR
ncbi:hypothetical protein ACV22V_00870 [Burkholderia sp. AW33-5]